MSGASHLASTDALKQFGNYEKLGKSQLAKQLSLIEKHLFESQQSSTKSRGLALEQVLKEAHDSLKPDDNPLFRTSKSIV